MTKSIDKFITCFLTGGFLTVIELLFGHMDYSMVFLFIAMAADFATGILVGFSEKKLSSRICVNGLFRKFMILIYVMLGHHLDVLLNVDYVRIGVCYMYAASEVMSILENGAKLGVPIPEPIRKALELLNPKKEETEAQDDSK